MEPGSPATIARFESTAPPSTPPIGFDYPTGFFALDLANVPPGGTVRVTLTFAPGTRPVGYVKCGASGCALYPNATIDGDSVTLTLTDGGSGDADGLANGVITDPGAPAVRKTSLIIRDGGGSLNPLLLFVGLLGWAWRRTARRTHPR
jgi:hypothetical protein